MNEAILLSLLSSISSVCPNDNWMTECSFLFSFELGKALISPCPVGILILTTESILLSSTYVIICLLDTWRLIAVCCPGIAVFFLTFLLSNVILLILCPKAGCCSFVEFFCFCKPLFWYCLTLFDWSLEAACQCCDIIDSAFWDSFIDFMPKLAYGFIPPCVTVPPPIF